MTKRSCAIVEPDFATLFKIGKYSVEIFVVVEIGTTIRITKAIHVFGFVGTLVNNIRNSITIIINIRTTIGIFKLV